MAQTIYTCNDIICEHFTNYIIDELAAAGQDYRAVVAQYNEIHKDVKGVYPRALLMKGLVAEDSPTFANTPDTNSRVSAAIRNHLEYIFQMLCIPTTQKAAYKLANLMRKQGITTALGKYQLEALKDMYFVKSETARMESWLIRARGIIVVMCNNFPELATVTDEEKDFSDLFAFDWYYDYSDSRPVRNAGEARHRAAITEINKVLAEKPHLIKVVTVIAKSVGFSNDFFTKPF